MTSPSKPAAPANRLDQLTSLRGIAAWWVVFYHTREFLDEYVGLPIQHFLANGFLAVDLFFIMSGFVIYLNYNSKVSVQNPSSVLYFMSKRFARVYPLHLFTLLLYISVPVILFATNRITELPPRYDLGAFAANFFLIDTWGLTADATWNIPSWSISAEWFSYLLFPVIAFALLAAPTVWRMLAVMAATGCAVGLYFHATGYQSLGDDLVGSANIRCALQFIIGCVIGKLYTGMSLQSIRPSLQYIFLLAGIGILSLAIWGGVRDYIVAPAAFIFIVIALTSAENLISKILLLPPLIYLGDISYSTYMIHYIFRDYFKYLFVKTEGVASLPAYGLLILAIFAASAICYKLVEVPAQKYLNNVFSGWFGRRAA